MWINLFFQLFIWEPCTWPVKMTGQMKVCPDKWPTWLGTVHWPAISLSTDNRQLNQKNKLCMLLKSIPTLWLLHQQTKKIPYHDPIIQRIELLGIWVILFTKLPSKQFCFESQFTIESHKPISACHVMMMMMMMMMMITMMINMITMMINMIKMTIWQK